MGKHSGRHAFREKLKALGYDLGQNALNEAFGRFKDLADKKKHVFDDDIIALVDDALARGAERIQVKALRVIAGTEGPQEAHLTLVVDGVEQSADGDRRRAGGRGVQRHPARSRRTPRCCGSSRCTR